MSNLPKVGSVWRHRNGAEYRVIHLANFYSSDVRYPLTVVYQGVVNGKVWSRPMDQWHLSMTLVAETTQPATGEPVTWMYDTQNNGRQYSDKRLDHYWRDAFKDSYVKGVPLYAAPPAAAHGDEAALWELLDKSVYGSDEQQVVARAKIRRLLAMRAQGDGEKDA